MLDVREGDFLLAVDGVALRAPDDPYRLLADRRDRVRLTVAASPTGPGRTILVNPIADETEIRKLDWIARNRATIDRLSGGKAGYLYLSDFDELGSEDFLRQYYQQTGKAALVIDDRDNRGGFTSQWVLDLLRRPQAGVFRNREGGITTLPGAISPPRLVTLTSIFSASDGDQFPYFFRQWGMGMVVGQRTWGGVRGIKGPWHLVDGTYVTVPKDSLLTREGATIIENHGAEPDLVIDDTPDDVATGRDRQLERAVSTFSKASP
jgi:tricorn protease